MADEEEDAFNVIFSVYMCGIADEKGCMFVVSNFR